MYFNVVTIKCRIFYHNFSAFHLLKVTQIGEEKLTTESLSIKGMPKRLSLKLHGFYRLPQRNMVETWEIYMMNTPFLPLESSQLPEK